MYMQVESVDSLLAVLAARYPDVPREALRASLPLWGAVRLRREALLWKEGRPADSLALLVSGELDVVVEGTVINTVDAVTLLGETALFEPSGVRFASMRALSPSVALTLPASGVAYLRERADPLYEVLLRDAIRCVSARTQTLDRQVAQVRKGNFAEPLPPERSGLFKRAWRRMTQSGPDPGPCPPLAEVLRDEPVLAQASEEVRAALLAAFTPQSFRAHEALTRQDATDSRVFVLASGRANVLRVIEEHGGALLLGTIEPGTIFGINAFASDLPRSASIVALTDGWCYAMSREAFQRLTPATQRAWLEVTLALYVRQYQGLARALQTSIRVFASRHVELMSSKVSHDPPKKDKAKKDRAKKRD